jgi:hypothetical protein
LSKLAPGSQRGAVLDLKAVLAQVAAHHVGQAQVVVDQQQVACHGVGGLFQTGAG